MSQLERRSAQSERPTGSVRSLPNAPSIKALEKIAGANSDTDPPGSKSTAANQFAKALLSK
jgi:hypothetical protein